MTSPAKRKGDRAENEVVDLLNDYAENRWHVERAYGAGRPDDRGDLDGLPHCIAQVRNWRNVEAAERTALESVGAQLANAPLDYRYAVALVRHPRGRWVVSMTVPNFVRMLRDATA